MLYDVFLSIEDIHVLDSQGSVHYVHDLSLKEEEDGGYQFVASLSTDQKMVQTSGRNAAHHYF